MRRFLLALGLLAAASPAITALLCAALLPLPAQGQASSAPGMLRDGSNGSIISAGGTASRSLADRFADVVNVKDFGALGDGANDDTAEIQLALDTGKDVFFPKTSSYYKISAALSPLSGQRIYGEGVGSQIRQVTSLANVITCTSKTDVIIEYLKIYAVGDNSSQSNGAGIYLNVCSKSIIRGVTFENHRGGGIVLSGSNDNEVSGNLFINAAVSGIVNDLDVDGDIDVIKSSNRNIIANNRHVSGAGHAILVQSVLDGETCNDNIITGNIIKDYLLYGIVVYRNSQALPILQTLERTVISNNIINNITGGVLNSISGTYTYGAGIYVQGAEDTVVSGNIVNRAHSAAVTFADTLAPGGIGVTNATRGTITGNQISNSGVNGMDISDANGFGAARGGLTVGANTILSSTLRGIRIRTSNHVSLLGNNISLTGSHGIEVNLSTTVLVNGYVITGNRVKDVTGTGINLNYISNAAVNDNLVDTTSVAGITAANSADISVNDNTVKNHTTRGIQLTSTVTGSTVSGNTVVGTGTSTEGIRLDALATIGPNRVSGNTSGLVGSYSVLRGTQSGTAFGNIDIGEDDLNSFVLPASSMVSTADTVNVVAWGITQNNANAKTLRMYFGTQLILTTALTISQTNVWSVRSDCIRTGSSVQRCFVQLNQGGAIAQTDVEYIAATQTETAAITVKFTGEATTNNDIQQFGMIVKFSKG